MAKITLPAGFVPLTPAAIGPDDLNDAIAANRTAILATVAQGDANDARIAALEAKVTATPVPPSVVYVDITAAQETALTAVGVGSLVVLRGPAGPAGQTTIILERKP